MRKLVGEELRASERRFRAVFEQAAVGVAILETPTGRFVSVNQRYCAILGMTPGELTATTFMAITHRDDLREDLEQMEKMQQGIVPNFTMEKRLLRPDGGAVWVNLTVSPMWSPGETPNFHVAVIVDITRRKQAEEEIRQFNQTLEQRVANRTRSCRRPMTRCAKAARNWHRPSPSRTSAVTY
ncbi:MAG: PAS domain S-box protein [Rhodobacteraceae bacterium]|nr:PAS domain S-box protein [Paracoccaceae bacterium]